MLQLPAQYIAESQSVSCLVMVVRTYDCTALRANLLAD